MFNSKMIRSLIFASFAIIAHSGAEACPEPLKGYSTRYLGGLDVCSAHDRYQAALERLRQQGIENPERIGILMGPRFINYPDWNRSEDQSASAAWYIYAPAPETWFKWEAGAHLVDTQAVENYHAGRVAPITFDWLKKIHATALNGLIEKAGSYRRSAELGLAVSRAEALTESESAGAKAVEYTTLLTPNHRLVSFTPTQCLEDRTPEFQAEFAQQRKEAKPFYRGQWPAISDDPYFLDGDGKKKQCGYLTYAPLEEVEPQLQAWLEFINSRTKNWGTPHPSADPIFVAARAQRWFIAIHPYERGNGRMSRFVMDVLLKSLGLPAPLLKDMNADMYFSERQWTQEVGNGVVRAIKAAELCAKKPSTRHCAPIPQPMHSNTLTGVSR